MFKLSIDLNLICVSLFVLVCAILLLFVLLDVNYFLRVGFTILKGRYFEKPVKIDGTSEIFDICTTNDLDLFLNYMSNSRYVRAADFGRFHFLDRTGLLKVITKAKAHIMQGACNVRFRRPIPLTSTYKLTTKIVYWDEKSIFFEQQFITSDGFIRAVIISQNKLINLSVPETMAKLMDKDESYRPDIPEEVKLWVSSITASSNRLRKTD
ncbi:PREDICTED: protein THEM6-like [Nicrophorus vespilloides]|uniref:Protein THEM6 n=1 Tax=Nicrophorus vespilloides TaxID=110193 RepID=A0ABM1MMS6_NICVS|nr:PREDICTED: protein THEM6-like [Nicrophorus vespilloides]